MSGTQVSAWQTPNELLTSMETPALVQRNQLLNQEAQQTINANEMEQISRASNWVISQDPENKDPAKQAAAYGAAVKLLRANNFAKNAPEQYPGFDAMQMMARQGTPSAEQFKLDQQRLGGAATLKALGIGGDGGGAPGATAPPADGGGGFSSDKETARRQVLQQETGGEANPATALNYVARADPTAYARGATASGKYQFVNSTWREGMQLAGLDPAQYPTARDAPDKVQDQVFDAVYAKYGTKPWEKGPKDWVKDEQGRYQLATVRPPPGSPGGAPVTAAAAPPGGGVAARYPGAVNAAGPAVGTVPAVAPGAAAAPPGPVTTIEPETGLPMLSGPPNALAPPPPPPATPPPAAPAATAPAATAPPPPALNLPPIPPPPQTSQAGFTKTDEAVLTSMAQGGYTREQILAEADKRRTANITTQRQYAVDVAARQDKVAAAQHQATEEARQAEELRLRQDDARRAQAKEDREAVLAGRPFQGQGADVQNRNILIEGTRTGKTDTPEYQSAYADYAQEKRTDNGLTYKPDMSPYATPTGKVYGEGKGGRELGKMDPSQGALAPPAINTAMLGNAAALRNIDNALKELNAHPGSVGALGLAPDFLLQRTDPEGVQLRADIGDLMSSTFHDRSGAAVMISEAERMKPFVPAQTDSAAALRTKLERMRNSILGVLKDHYSVYGPEGGGRNLKPVEIAIQSTAPAAPPGPRPPDKPRPAGFDQKVN